MAPFRRILITGGEGMLGQAFTKICTSKYPEAEVYGLSKYELDVTDFDHVKKVVNDIMPDFVIHCAALVHAELCEEIPERAETVIYEGTKNIVKMVHLLDAKLLYPQSFLVYNGSELPITEKTLPNPTFVYGFEKLRAEEYIKKNLRDFLIVIMAGFFGGYEKDKNFIGKIFPAILNAIKNGQKEIEIGDRIWQPTFTDDLAANSILLAEKCIYSRYCMSSYGEVSFADLTTEIIKCLGLSKQLTVKKVSSQKIAGQERAHRPDRMVLSNKAMEDEDLCIMRDWRVSLKEYLSNPYFQNQVKGVIKNKILEKSNELSSVTI